MELYKLDFPNGKSYIGITSTTADKRFKKHCEPSQKKHPCQFAIHKYGAENIKITVLEEYNDWGLLCLAEIEAIAKYDTFNYKNGYNLTLGGEGVLTVNIFGEERIKRDKEIGAAKDKKYNKDNKLLISAKKKEYYQSNIESIKIKKRKWREKNKEAIAEKGKEYRNNNETSLKNRKKQWREKNKASINAASKKYREANREKLRLDAQNRRAIARNPTALLPP